MVSSTPRPHFNPGKDSVPILQEDGCAPGQVWTGGKSRPQRNSIPDRPDRSQSLYQLSYPAHKCSLILLPFSGHVYLFYQFARRHVQESFYAYCHCQKNSKPRIISNGIKLTTADSMNSILFFEVEFINSSWEGYSPEMKKKQ